MPLIKSKSKDDFKSNLKAELSAGKPKDRALAIAYRVQREAKASGGGVGSPPFWVRSEARGLERSGYVPGATAGRADKVPASVKTNSYVIPADIVSGIGQGNSTAGAHALYRMFGMGPYGSTAMRSPSMRSGKPKKMFADGGAADGDHPITEIQISDGEFSVPPEKVAEIGGGDIDHGHAVLDAFVKHIRKKTIKSLKSLPGPKNG